MNQDANNNPDIVKLPRSITRSRSDDRLNNLPIEDQELLISWLRTLSYTQAAQRIAKPRPEGFGIQTSRTAVHRFYKKYKAIQAIEAALELVPVLAPELNDHSLEARLNYLLQSQASIPQDSPQGDLVGFQRLARLYSRLRDQDLRNRALDLRERNLALKNAMRDAQPQPQTNPPGNFVTTSTQSEKVCAVYAQAH